MPYLTELQLSADAAHIAWSLLIITALALSVSFWRD